ncbi:hypothetical protein ACFSHQ_16400 [Gemmobacter lanyuensis]
MRPSSVVIAGASVRLRRDAQGRFDLDLGGGAPLRDLGPSPIFWTGWMPSLPGPSLPRFKR